MSLLIPRLEEQAHWYTVTGEPRHDADLREARKATPLLLPSVTSILKMCPKHGLFIWKTEQIVLSAITLPMLAGESMDDFAIRVVNDAETQADKARQFGADFHYGCEQVLRKKMGLPCYPIKKEIQPWVDQFVLWFNDNVEDVFWTEKTLINPVLGYAGKADAKLRLKGIAGKVVLDIKSQDVKLSKAKVPKPAVKWYDEWVMQLAAYRESDPDGDVDGVVSLAIDSKVPLPPHQYAWTSEEVDEGWKDFLAYFAAWKRCKKYEPIQPVKAVVEEGVACVG